MKIRRCSFFTLIEVIIASILTAILLSALLFFYHSFSTMNSRMEQEQQESFQLRYLESRLLNTLSKAMAPSQKAYYLTSDDTVNGEIRSPSLIFVFDNGIQLDPELSNAILGRIYLDKEGNLFLASWPSPTKWSKKKHFIPPMKKMLLLKEVEKIRFEFFLPPEKGYSKKSNKKMTKQEEKRSENHDWLALKEGWNPPPWKLSFKTLPAMVRMTILRKNGKEWVFTFPIPKAKRFIVYDEEK